ncbi:MAG: sulfotransferase [Pseudomonadota bacterium]
MRNSASAAHRVLGRVYTFFKAAPIVIDDPVVIIHSPFKTGTTTVGNALVSLGVGSEDHGYHKELNVAYKNQMNEANRIAMHARSFKAFERLHGKHVRIMLAGLTAAVEGYRIFGDVPLGHLRMHPFTKKLIMPKARFIWIDREEEAWLESAKKWHLAHPEIYPGSAARWKNRPDKERSKLIELRDNGFKEFRRLQESFPGDCLVLSLEKDANWNKLCDFLDKPIPDQPFPMLNSSQ